MGLFPMAYSAGSPYVHWVCPEMRGQLSIENLHIPKSLSKLIKADMKAGRYEVRIDTAFEEVIRTCAAPAPNRPESWINPQIIEAYCRLHREGRAHSVEYWRDGKLQGGLYGLEIGGAFFGESMFSRQANASRIALVHLAARLYRGGFTLLDTQFVNDHLRQFGVYEIPHEDYKALLDDAVIRKADFACKGVTEPDLVRGYLVHLQQQAQPER